MILIESLQRRGVRFNLQMVLQLVSLAVVRRERAAAVPMLPFAHSLEGLAVTQTSQGLILSSLR